MIRSLWKKVCKDQGVTPQWEHKQCLKEIEELETKIENSKEYIHTLKNKMLNDGKNLGSKNFVCLRTKNSIQRHEENIQNFILQKEILMKKLDNMKLDF